MLHQEPQVPICREDGRTYQITPQGYASNISSARPRRKGRGSPPDRPSLGEQQEQMWVMNGGQGAQGVFRDDVVILLLIVC